MLASALQAPTDVAEWSPQKSYESGITIYTFVNVCMHIYIYICVCRMCVYMYVFSWNQENICKQTIFNMFFQRFQSGHEEFHRVLPSSEGSMAQEEVGPCRI